MSIIKPKGLEGLKGIGDLSKQEYDAFIKNNEALISQHSYDPAYISTLYKNKQFIDKFGIDNFKALPDINQRNELYRDTIIRDAFAETFKGDRDYNSLAAQLDTQGMYDLMNNSNYIGTIERDKRLKRDVEAAKRVGKSYDAAIENPYVDAIGAGFMQVGKTSAAERPYEQDEKYANNDKEIREKLFAETQERRETGISNITDSIYNAMLASDSNGAKSLNQSYNEFDALATEKSPHYAAFKDSKWLKDYTHEERLKDYAKYQALSEKYGDGIATQYLDRTIQNRVSEAQDGKWTGNTLKGVFTTLISDLGSNIALFSHLGTSPDKIGIINQGKDPNKPIYNDKGEIIDYEKDDNWFTNPAYWNNVTKYNTFSPTEIRAIEERGGISEDINVRDYGSTPDFLSWDTVEEGFKQAGHWGAFWIESALAGGAGKAIGFAGKTAMKGLGLSTKAMKAASKVGNITNDVFVTATSGISGAQLEAMGTFDEQMQSAREKIQDQIQQELHDYYNSIDYNSKEAKAAINNYYQQLKKQDQRRMSSNKSEGSSQLPLSDEFLMEQAKRQYTQDLLSNEQRRLEEIHKKDEFEAAKAATKAYGTNFFMDWVKNAPFDLAIQKFKFAKGSMKGVFDNTIDKNIIQDATTGGVKRAGAKLSSAKNVAKEIGKQLGGGFADEYLDGLNASFASGVGSNAFDNYIRKTYNPETYNAATESLLGNLISGFSEGVEGLTDRGNLYEGFIGMMAPASSVMVNPNSLYHPKDAWRAIVSGTDTEGNKLNFAERLSNALMNPILSTYADLAQQDRAIDSSIDAINKVIADNKDKLQDAAKIISVLDNYNSPLVRTKFNLNEGDNDEALNAPTLLDTKDNKLYNAFTLIDALKSLESIDGGTNSALYQDTMNTLDGLANGTLSSEEQDSEIDKFLADEDNKSILDSPNARELAAEKLQENAKYLLDMKAKMEDIYSTFAKSTSLKGVDPRVKNILAYNLVAEDDYKKRLNSLEEELSLSSTNTEEMFVPNYAMRYGTDKAKEQAVEARRRTINKIQDEVGDLNSDISSIKEKINSLRIDLRNTSDGNKTAEIQKKIKENQNLLSAKDFHRITLIEKISLLQDEADAIDRLDRGNDELVLTEDDILGLDARDRAEVLNPENKNRYSKKQQKVIEHTRKKLLKNDPEALQKVMDAGVLAQKITDLNSVYDKITQNRYLASEYLSAVEQIRDTAAMAESLQRGIDEHYSKIEKAYTNRFIKKPRNIEKRQEEFKKAILSTNEAVLEAYIEDHPEQAEQVQPYYEMIQLENDLASIIKQNNSSVSDKIAQLQTIASLEGKANNRTELQSSIEEIIDSSDVTDDVKAQFEDLLSKAELLGYQRDATVIENRKQRKQREEAAKKKLEEERARVEAEAKAAAEKAKAQAENKKQVNRERTKEDYEKAEISNLEDVDLEEDNSPASQSPVSQSPLNPSDLLKDNVQEDSINYGTIWYNDKNPQEGDLIVSKKNGKGLYGPSQQITLSVNNTPLSFSIGSNDWIFSTSDPNGLTKEAASALEITKDTPYQVNSIEKINGVWYFNGTFANKKNSTIVRMSDSFDLSAAINQEKSRREVKYASQGTNVLNDYIKNDGDTVIGSSPSLESQAMPLQNAGNDVKVVDSSLVEFSNPIEKSSSPILSGNAMSEWQIEPLEKDGILKHKEGSSSNDSMNKYFKWMNAAGIKLQNIIDNELADILAASEDPVKVKFMAVRPQPNATNDADVKTHLFLVLDYDNNINKGITEIHNNSNGGVIESKGKQYLIIGVTGYGNINNTDKLNLYNTLFSNNPNKGNGYGLVKRGMGKFFKDNPTERFYIPDNLSTEIVPNSLIPGYIVRQTEKDDSPMFRRIKELLNDEERNPQQLDIKSLAWGIQEREKFLLIRASSDSVMVPRNPLENLGRAFVLIPASNGKLVPAFIKPLFFVEMNDGKLKDRINDLLSDVVSPDYTTRYNAIIELSKIFYFDSDNDDILTMRTKNVVSLVHNGEIVNTFTLDSNFDRQAFLQAFSKLNPRINITSNVLTNDALFQQYDEAGALTTDCAKLGTAGSSYSIYGVNANGEILKTDTTNNDSFSNKGSDDFKNRASQIVYKHNFYREKDGNFYLNGALVTDEATIRDLQYNKVVVDGKLSPITSNGIWEYYILNAGDSPSAIKINKNTKEVKEATPEQAKELVNKFLKKDDAAEREKAAKKELNNSQANVIMRNVEDVDLGFGSEPSVDALELQGVQDVDLGIDLEESKKEEKEEESPAQSQGSGPITQQNERVLSSGNKQMGTQSFDDLIKSMSYRLRIIQLIKTKWLEAPSKISALSEFLRKKNIEVDSIGTTDAAIQAWIKTIEECR